MLWSIIIALYLLTQVIWNFYIAWTSVPKFLSKNDTQALLDFSAALQCLWIKLMIWIKELYIFLQGTMNDTEKVLWNPRISPKVLEEHVFSVVSIDHLPVILLVPCRSPCFLLTPVIYQNFSQTSKLVSLFFKHSQLFTLRPYQLRIVSIFSHTERGHVQVLQ